MFEEAVSEASSAEVKSLATEDLSSVISTSISDEDGNIYDIDMFEYAPAATVSGDTHTKTFVYSTEAEYITPRASSTQTNAGWDSSVSVYGYLTITYNTSQSQYLLTGVSGGWDIADSYVTITDRYVAYTCQYFANLSQTAYRYPSSNTFSYQTNFSGYIPNDGTTSALGALSIADLAHGVNSRWELRTETMLFSNNYDF